MPMIHTGTEPGAAYVFAEMNRQWGQQGKLTPTDGDAVEQFGSAVALDGPTALIGAPRDADANGDGAGAAYVIERTNDGWTEHATLVGTDGDQGDVFGTALALAVDTALIGAPFDEDPTGDAAGSRYVFTPSDGSWKQQAKLTPDNSDRCDVFGGAVALADHGETAVIGAYWDDAPNGTKAGSVYVFEQTSDGWTQQTKLAAGDSDSEDEFGWAVALANGTALVGAPRDEDPNGGESGAAYVASEADGT